MNLEQAIKGVNKVGGSAYREGVRAERKRNLTEMKRIAGFPEMGAREQLKDYITHLEEQE